MDQKYDACEIFPESNEQPTRQPYEPLESDLRSESPWEDTSDHADTGDYAASESLH